MSAVIIRFEPKPHAAQAAQQAVSPQAYRWLYKLAAEWGVRITIHGPIGEAQQ